VTSYPVFGPFWVYISAVHTIGAIAPELILIDFNLTLHFGLLLFPTQIYSVLGRIWSFFPQ